MTTVTVKPAIEIVKEALATIEAGEINRYAEFLADDFALYVNGENTGTSKEMLLGMLQALRTAVPDLSLNVSKVQEVDGDSQRISFHNRLEGTHTQDMVIPGLEPGPASHRKVQHIPQIATYTLQDGKIVSEHIETPPGADPLSLYKQLGVEFPA